LAVMDPESGFGFRDPGSGVRISGAGFRGSGFGVRTAGISVRSMITVESSEPGTRFRISDFGLRVSISGCGFRVSGSGFRVPGFGFRVSDFKFPVPGFGLRVSDFQNHDFRISQLRVTWLRVCTGAGLEDEEAVGRLVRGHSHVRNAHHHLRPRAEDSARAPHLAQGVGLRVSSLESREG